MADLKLFMQGRTSLPSLNRRRKMAVEFNMKKGVMTVLIGLAFLVPHTAVFSDDGKDNVKTKTHLLQEILLLNKQISKINHINNKSRTILKKTKNKYAFEIYISFVNVYKTFLWCSDLSHWLSQTYNMPDNMNDHINARLIANRTSVKKTLGYVNKVYKNINDVNLLNIIDTQEKVIDVALGQLDKILEFSEKMGGKKIRKNAK